MTLRLKSCFLGISLIFFTLVTAYAQVSLKGYFIAGETCEAYQSIKKATNPGRVRLVKDMKYELVAKNKDTATHYLINIPDAKPKERWVSTFCGEVFTNDAPRASTKAPASPALTSPRTPRPDYLLAISWQPAFCQTHQKKAECRTQDKERYDADHFSLHGLWPQPESNKYCRTSPENKALDLNKEYDRLPEPGISGETFEQLSRVMPGTRSFLHRHEWTKHGTCYAGEPDEYFRESVMLMDQINASAVRDYFFTNIGNTLSASDIRAKFDQAFGPGAGKKVNVKCRQGLITELWINLKGEITPQSNLGLLIENAEPAESECRAGIVDPVGF